ncbi:MAG: aldo/keto reductase [Erysipelotrichaceae bacterium]|nr:aldo/keto reductase [Erysipelotrichaceae bacterium]
MERTKLSDNLSFSRIIQGFWRLTSWNLTSKQLVNFIEERVDLGVTTFDTAEIYGRGDAEIQLGEALKLKPELRSKIEIVTKTNISIDQSEETSFGYYDSRYDRIINSCKKSIKNMNCNYIDLYLIHREDPCIDFKEVARALNDLKEMGLVKEIGVSNFDPMKFKCLYDLTNKSLVTNQIEVNPQCFEHFDSGMIDYLTYKGIHPMFYSPVSQGLLFTSDEDIYLNSRILLSKLATKYNTTVATLVYAWLMYHPVSGMPIVGSKNIERIKEAINAFDIKLDHVDWYKIYTSSKQKVLR